MRATSVADVKLLHTSDWHLGRTLHGVDMHEHQRAFVDHLVDVVVEQQITAVLISGDVYDRAIPAVETVQVFDDALARLSAVTTVIVTPGNHDSAVRLGFGAALMRDSVRILSSVRELHRPVVLTDDATTVAVYGLPYLDPDSARPLLADSDDLATWPARSHEGVVAAAMQRVRDDLGARQPMRSVVLAHAFVVGAEPSDSERDLSVGGVQSVPSTVFDGVDYVALGHLHGPQVVPVPGSATLARYSGSPLAYSFSERHHAKSVVLVEVPAAGPVVTTLVPTPVPRPLTELAGTLDELLSPVHDAVADHWLKIVVTDAQYPADLQGRLRARFAHVLHVVHQPAASGPAATTPVVTEQMAPPQVAADFVAHVSGTDATDDELAEIERAYETVLAGEREG